MRGLVWLGYALFFVGLAIDTPWIGVLVSGAGGVLAWLCEVVLDARDRSRPWVDALDPPPSPGKC